MAPMASTSIFGNPIVIYPNMFKYSKMIYVILIHWHKQRAHASHVLSVLGRPESLSLSCVSVFIATIHEQPYGPFTLAAKRQPTSVSNTSLVYIGLDNTIHTKHQASTLKHHGGGWFRSILIWASASSGVGWRLTLTHSVNGPLSIATLCITGMSASCKTRLEPRASLSHTITKHCTYILCVKTCSAKFPKCLFLMIKYCAKCLFGVFISVQLTKKNLQYPNLCHNLHFINSLHLQVFKMAFSLQLKPGQAIISYILARAS